MLFFGVDDERADSNNSPRARGERLSSRAVRFDNVPKRTGAALIARCVAALDCW